MATPKGWYATARIGGGADALDAIDGDDLTDKDVAIVLANNIFWLYLLDDDGAGAESDPGRILPDANPGTKVWILQKCFGEKNQIEILVLGMDPWQHNVKSIKKSVTETILLLEEVTEK